MKYNIHTLEISKENILSRTSELSLWKYYCPNFVENQRFYSEFYPDSNPGCVVYFNNDKGLYYDFGEPDHSYDIFGYVQRKYNINYFKALQLINTDFNLKLGWFQGNSKYSLGYPGIPSLVQAKDSFKKQIKVKIRDWNNADKEYWKDRYNISSLLLNKYNVYPLSHYWIIKQDKEVFITCKSITYGYYFGGLWKIYAPYAEYKWISNTTKDIIQGYDQLELGDNLVITSSLKDVLCWKNSGFNSIAPQSEAQVFNNAVLNSLEVQYKRIFINMDSDEAGKEYALEWLKMSPKLINIEIPEFKDLSDYIENYGFEKAQQLVKDLI